ncbi:hypothetical protein Pint_05498 [Pistacia integerrima]|uniref:Uncharacterized protein n=1 Tax=Pistacia integerrima TaxID=434235 RepID=A0ACC0Z7E8_9ROSI|nr:hypothetical protein Pint_05498 [Pistacia integerrima]
MGVHGLWDLLARVGRRVSVETLAGKRLAIDASIWMVQFMKAMRDEKGEMTKPVFVVDGGTPVLKRRTVIARWRQRENARAQIRKTVEKLLINHLKTMRLKELAKDLEDQRKKQNNASKALASSNKGNQDAMLAAPAAANLFQEDGDEDEEIMMITSIAVEEHESLTDNESIPAGSIPFKEEDGDEDEEMILMSVAEARQACQSQYGWIKEALGRLVEQLTSQRQQQPDDQE